MEITTIFPTYALVFSIYTLDDPGEKYLARAGGGIYFVINDNLTSRTAQLFHLDTTIKLAQLLRRIKEQTSSDPDEEEY